ncbi:hypothetical protein [Catenuloplanes atrovinosus]|uniref:Uncharacterized protein n=1 Tax=Catenuloplanes atrovinosus TaxID=137266 RepID=A0AAE3YNB9_9ACTN|nr:hypothetical protein [Catenuloplanes atrovinosus]MDR7275536.1 hypothetical protein [Catenuloplanes atrovinosus]
MDAALLGVVAALGGTVLGAGGQFLQSWLQLSWQRHEQARHVADRLIDDRRNAYVDFMAAASAHGNRMAELCFVKNKAHNLGVNGVEQATTAAFQARQDLMIPLWRMRLVASEQVRAAGEEVMQALWSMEERYKTATMVEVEQFNPHIWVPAREKFLAASRAEISALSTADRPRTGKIPMSWHRRA